jgi:hypothetical protein
MVSHLRRTKYGDSIVLYFFSIQVVLTELTIIHVSFPVVTGAGIYFVLCRASDRQTLLLLHSNCAGLHENDALQNNPKFTADF